MSVDVSRRIVLLRHAKADWPDGADHDRPLAERGRKDAPVAGDWLAARRINFDLTLCSTAVRTRETWKLVVSRLEHRPKTVYEDRLYEASPGEIIAVLNELPEDCTELLVVGHNPGIQGVAEVLTGEAEPAAAGHMERLGFPTSAVAVLAFAGDWKALQPGSARLTEHWAPHE
ncbi:histidine phosphatase family protein [Streptomyces sp. XM4193]|uniref:SixA phosphatase family protein n=1 Tax=Streptomyces sp. XM4193 TaxID=2929782 RepID=UPI001FFAC875|nr:histidine phosphatase family protein [Streptomyces sp. XM4193]MCK1796549.1 histidine phosphatase family protein [Streptomyces sp. XM4193]